MLTLTHEAAEAIRGLTEGAPPATDVRLFATEPFGDRETPPVRIEVVPWPEALDTVIEAEGVRLYVEAETMRALDHKVLAVDWLGDEPRFELLEQRNGQAA